MKNPQLVILLIFDERFEQYYDDFMQFPIQQEGQYFIIKILKFQQYISKKLQLTEIEMQQINLEFFDITQKKFVEDQQFVVYDCFQFTKNFFGEPKILEMKLKFIPQYWNIVQLNENLELQSKTLQQIQQQERELRQKLDKQPYKLKEIEDDLDEIKQDKKMVKQKKSIDIAILYNSALIQLDNEIQEAQFIDYESEIRTIKNEIKNSNINYEILKATRENFDYVLRLNPQVLHLIINGDCNYENGSPYFETQEEDGKVDKLSYEDLQQIFKYHNRSLKRLKLICISSFIAKHFKIDQWEEEKTFVRQIKPFNSEDKYGNEFWKSFYKQLIEQKSFEISYNNATKNVEELFQKDLNEKLNNFTICCCYHEHNTDCQENPLNNGYKQCHEKHIRDLDNFGKELIQQIQDNNTQISQIQTNQCCYCNNTGDQNSYYLNQHHISQKFIIKKSKNFKEQNLQINLDQQINQDQSHNNKESKFQINQQIIIIYSESTSPNKFNLLYEKILNYYKNYSKIKKLQLIESTQQFDDLNQNVNEFLDESDDKLKILRLTQIDQYCDQDKKKFQNLCEDLLTKFKSKQNLIIIFELSDKNLKYLDIEKYREFVQHFSYDSIEETLQKQGKQ